METLISFQDGHFLLDFPHDEVKEIEYGLKEESTKTSGGNKHDSSSNSKSSKANGVLTTTRPIIASSSLPSDIGKISKRTRHQSFV